MNRSTVTVFEDDYDWEDYNPRFACSGAQMFNGNRDAYELTRLICYATNVWDDLIDEDQLVQLGEVNYAFIALSHDMQNNKMWRENHESFMTLWSTSITAWLTSITFEEHATLPDLHLAHVLRFMPAQIAIHALYLAHNRNIAAAMLYIPRLTRVLYNDDLEAYLKEVSARGNVNAE